MGAYIAMWKNFFKISGRAPLMDYVFVFFINMGIWVIAAVIGGVTEAFDIIGNVMAVYTLAYIIPYTTLSIRRLHDCNRSGWWLLLFPPAAVWFLFSKGNEEGNDYGDAP